MYIDIICVIIQVCFNINSFQVCLSTKQLHKKHLKFIERTFIPIFHYCYISAQVQAANPHKLFLLALSSLLAQLCGMLRAQNNKHAEAGRCQLNRQHRRKTFAAIECALNFEISGNSQLKSRIGIFLQTFVATILK